MSQPKCLSKQELSEFVEGRIDAGRVEQIAAHLEACGDCQSTVVMLGERSDTFIELLRSPAVPDPLETEDACQAAVERLVAHAVEGRSGPGATMPTEGEIKQVGPYRIQGELGVGGMGTVFEAVHTKLKRSVALKLLPASRWANPAAVARFEREMEVIGQLDHPNIVRASDAGEEHGMHYLVMEHVDGLDLSRIVSRVGPLRVAEACEIARQAAIGLQYAHENHLVHRDIKPSNLMLAGSGRRSTGSGPPDQRAATVKILDLGLALLGDSHAAQENELTTVGQLMGTLDYMSPEQGMDSHDVDVRADIYSLGATLYKLLTGSAPFATPQYDTLLKKVSALANKPATPIQQLRSDIPDEVAASIDRMLSKDPEARFNTPEEVSTVLEPFARDANLGELLEVALAAKEPEADLVPPVISSRHLPPKPVPLPKPPVPRNGMRGWKSVLGLMVLIGLAMGAVFAIVIATDRGELVIRADESVQVAIRNDGNTVTELAVSKGENVVTVWSGAYRVELKGRSDELILSQDAVSIRRGGRVVVHVQKRPQVASKHIGSGMMGGAMSGMMGGMEPGMRGMMESEGESLESRGHSAGTEFGGMAMSDGPSQMAETAPSPGALGSGFGSAFGGGDSSVPAKPEPTYDGQSYRSWLVILKTERKPERLTEAMRAFGALVDTGNVEQATEAANAIMQLMRRYGSMVIDRRPQGELVQQAQTVLAKLPGKIIIEALERELKDGTPQSRAFAVMVLAPSLASPQGSRSANQAVVVDDLASAIDRREAQITKLLLELPNEGTATLRDWALSLVILRAKATKTPFGDVDGLLPKLREMMNSEEDSSLRRTAIKGLVKGEPDNPQLVPALIEVINSRTGHWHGEAARSLGRLGPRAAPAVKPLMELLTAVLKRVESGEGDAYAETDPYASGTGAGGFGGQVGTSSTELALTAIEALGNIGPAAKEALPLLKSVLDPEGKHAEYFQQAANLAIARIEGRKPPMSEEEYERRAAGAGLQGGFF